jgi:glutamate racemase
VSDPYPPLNPDHGPVCRIGIWDSGVGGLSVLRHCREQLPRASFHYFADRAFAPYGSQEPSLIVERSLAIAAHLEGALGCDALVMACNTATALAAEAVRASARVPVIALEPGVKPAEALTRSGKVAVLATPHTLSSHRFAALVARHAPGLEVLAAPAPGLVDLIEQGEFDGPDVQRCLERALEPVLAAGADVIILGCTHYPWVDNVVRRVAGNPIPLIDTGPAVARHLRQRLQSERPSATAAPTAMSGRLRFWCSGSVYALPEPIRLALGLPPATRFESCTTGGTPTCKLSIVT